LDLDGGSDGLQGERIGVEQAQFEDVGSWSQFRNKITFIPKLKGHMLTPKFGTGRSLICGPNLVKKSVRKKEGFSRKIRQRSSQSAIGFRSARKLFALILRDCVMTWPERKGQMDG
jgi:hypothetical protein